MYFRKIIGPRPLCLMLIKFSAYRARQSSVFFSFSSVISFKMRINTDESVLVGGSVIATSSLSLNVRTVLHSQMILKSRKLIKVLSTRTWPHFYALRVGDPTPLICACAVSKVTAGILFTFGIMCYNFTYTFHIHPPINLEITVLIHTATGFPEKEHARTS